jgi:hypothetical protein
MVAALVIMDVVGRRLILAQRLAALPEPAMREVVLARELGRLSPDEAVEALATLLTAARAPRGAGDLVAVAVLPAALARLPYDVAAALYAAAKASDRLDVARLFFTSSGEEPPPQPERFVPAAGRSLTLGERKSLARGRRREVLGALLVDPDASVIRALLENPLLTERDVIAVAARRPARADVLRVLFASRWVARYHVKRALVMNPHTPPELAVRLLPSLIEADRRLIAADANLPDVLRAAASASCPRPSRP